METHALKHHIPHHHHHLSSQTNHYHNNNLHNNIHNANITGYHHSLQSANSGVNVSATNATLNTLNHHSLLSTTTTANTSSTTNTVVGNTGANSSPLTAPKARPIGAFPLLLSSIESGQNNINYSSETSSFKRPLSNGQLHKSTKSGKYFIFFLSINLLG